MSGAACGAPCPRAPCPTAGWGGGGRLFCSVCRAHPRPAHVAAPLALEGGPICMVVASRSIPQEHRHGSKQPRRRDVRVSTLSEFDGEPRSQQPLHALRLNGGSSTRRADQALQPDDARGGSVTRARDTGAKHCNFFAFNLSTAALRRRRRQKRRGRIRRCRHIIPDGPSVNHHRLLTAGVTTDTVTLNIYEGTPSIELILRRSCTYSGQSNGIGPPRGPKPRNQEIVNPSLA